MIFHLLIVDDEPTIRKGLSDFIKWDSLDCVVDGTASDGAQALEMIAKKHPDIVITDIRMPQVDGITLAKLLSESYPQMKVIILTGYADFQYAQSAIRYGVSDFILKPTSKEKLQDAVKRAQSSIAENRNRTTVNKEELSYLREQFLSELTGTDTPLTFACEKAARYGIELTRFYVAAFQFGADSASLEGDGATLLKEVLEKEEGNNYIYSYGNQMILWIFEESGISRLLSLCKDILDTMSSLYALKLSVGISGLHQNLSELSVAAKEAIQAENRNFYEDSKLSVYDSFRADDFCSLYSEYMLDLYQFENCMKTWEFEEAGKIIKTLFSRLKVDLTRAFEVKNICTQIYYICGKILLKKELPPLSRELQLQIEECTTIGQLELLADQMIREARSLLMSQGKPLGPLTEKAVQYIHEHLDEPLSLDTIAAYVHVNPSHLSRIFKRDCGDSLTEYMNRVRIEKAKELLTDSVILAYEVAEQVGFNDPAYFSAIFKKYTGMSPKEYKQQGKQGWE